MITNFTYKELAYLLGCYIVIADKDINALEVNVLDRYLALSKEDELYKRRMEIFSDDENAIKEKDLIYGLKLKNLSNAEKEEVIRLIVRVAFGDNFVSLREKEILDNASQALHFNSGEIFNLEVQLSGNRIKEERLSSFKRFVGDVENVLYNTFADKSKKETIDRLLGSLGYSAAVEKITETATADLDRVSKIMDGFNSLLTASYNKLNSVSIIKSNSSKELQDVVRVVEATKVHFQELINVSLSKNLEMLEKKRRNIRYFTIAFMGRTKAGKSTLHKVITQQDNDDIGIGKLRTTRYNRSWYWEKLRIVDTPGIGAPGGEVDTEIAKSIIDEADVICYVVTSDSIQETEFDFFETIKERNKPLYIILNVKSNLSQSVRLQRFIANPFAWKEGNGPQSIVGHLNRIHDKLDGKYNMDAVEIIPIHLLAAQMGFSNEYDQQISTKLIDGSNIMEFVRSVKKEVHSSGGLKKSLSVIDGTAYQINSISSTIHTDCDEISKGVDILIQKRQKFKSFVETENSRLMNDLEIIFKGAKAELHNRAESFANEHYDDSEAGKNWQNDSVVSSIYRRLETKLQERMADFNEKAKAEIDEMASDIHFYFSTSASCSRIEGEKITNTRFGVGILGSVIVCITPFVIANIWNPAGWVLVLSALVVQGIVSMIQSLFTSKAEKIRKATEKLKNSLIEHINQSIQSNQSEVLENTKKTVLKMHKAIDDVLSTYISNTGSIIEQLKSLLENCRLNEDAINSLIGLRILEYAGKKVLKDKKIDDATNQELAERFPVSRDWKQQSLTFRYNVSISEKELKAAECATQMKISI